MARYRSLGAGGAPAGHTASIWISVGPVNWWRTALLRAAMVGWDECLNVEVFFTLVHASDKLNRRRYDYYLARPHSTLHNEAPASFAADRSATASMTQEPTALLEPPM